MTLAEYLHSHLGSLSSQLGWTVEAGSYSTIISETLELYGVGNEADATDITKLRIIGKYILWDSILTEVSFDYDISADGSSNRRSQMFEMIKQKRNDAYSQAMGYLAEYQIETDTFSTNQDPYKSYPPYYQRSI